MQRRIAAALGLALLIAFGDPAGAGEIYRWTDDQGRQHFTQNLADVPAAKRSAAEAAAREREPSRFQTYSDPASAQPAASRRPGHRSRALLSIPFTRHGNAMLVEVRVNDRVTAPFLVDTGATDVAIPAAVAAAAGIQVGPDTPHATYQTANGLIRKPIVTVGSLQVGEARVEGVRGSISDSMEVGLLGGSFFNNFTFQIDPAANLISLAPNLGVRAGLNQGQWQSRFRELRGQLAALTEHLENNHFFRESRVAELERKKQGLQEQLDVLEQEANQAEVPQAWRY